MNTQALILFLILLFGIILFSFLAFNPNKEGFDVSSTYNSSVNALSNAANTSYNTLSNAASNTYNSMSNNASGAYKSITENFDNYNHYDGTGSSNQLQNGMVFIDPSGDTVTVVTNSNGTINLQLLQVGQTTPMVLTSTPTSSDSSSNTVATPNTFYGPPPFQNITATVITDSTGQIAIQFNIQGTYIIFTQSGSNSNYGITPSQYYGSTGYQVPPNSSGQYYGAYGGSAGYATGPYGNTAYYAQGPNGNTVAGTTNNSSYPYTSSNQYYGPYGGSAGYATGPNGNTAYYAQGPNGNTVAGTTNNDNSQYNSSFPPGIPASQIPQGQEDLYILKSEIVPPVCPACPTSSACPREEPCPACPACARCPEPSFECKKVPNYNSINEDYLPVPILNSFAQFGM
jgi:hypothetical protein